MIYTMQKTKLAELLQTERKKKGLSVRRLGIWTTWQRKSRVVNHPAADYFRISPCCCQTGLLSSFSLMALLIH